LGPFQDENNFMIHKIKVIPKRDAEPFFEGDIYIVDNSWAIYAIDLDSKGYRMHQEIIDIMNLKQNFNYNKNNTIWAKNTQSIEFTAGIFGIKFHGKFSYAYNNYEFKKVLQKKPLPTKLLVSMAMPTKKIPSFGKQLDRYLLL
jgi:hypothetical protein